MANENKPGAQMPQLAYRNLRFLESADARALRIVSEYFDPLAHLRKSRRAAHRGLLRLGANSPP